MKPNEVVSLAQSLAAFHSEREAHYDELEASYGGYYTERKKTGIWKKVAGKFYPSYDKSDEQRNDFVINLAAPIVEQKRAFIGQIPSIRVPPPDESEEAQKLADLAEKAILGLWQYSNIGRLMSSLGFYCALFGTAIGFVWPNIKDKRPQLKIRSPRGFYPVPADDDGNEMSCVIFEETLWGKQADAMYPGFGYSGEAEVVTYRYIDDEVMMVVSSDSEVLVSPLQHKLGFCPVVTMPNIGIPESLLGDADIERMVELGKAINRRYAIMEDVAEKMAYPLLVVKGGQDVPDPLPTGPDAYIEVGPQGSVDQIYPPNMGEGFWLSTQQLESKIATVTDTPPLMQSDFQGSIMSGKAVNAYLSPLSARMGIRQNTIYPRIQQLNKFAILMWHRFPKFNQRSYVRGSQLHGNRSTFETSFVPDDLKWEGEIWTENEVYLDSATFVDRQANFISIIQAQQNRQLSRKRAMQLSPFVDDVTAEMRQIAKEAEEDMALAQAQAAGAEANVQPNLSEAGRTAYGLEKGYIGETEPVPPAGMESTPAMTENELSQPEFTAEDVIALLSEVPNLKGRVWLVGGALKGDISLGVELYIEDGNDKATIINYVGKKIPELVDTQTGNGELVFHIGIPPEGMEAVEITQGQTLGNEVVPPEEAPPEGV